MPLGWRRDQQEARWPAGAAGGGPFAGLTESRSHRKTAPNHAAAEAAPETTMADYNEQTYNTVADIISEVSSIDRDTITPDAHAINDLGIDSLDFLDVTFEIDKRFGIKMPVEQWMEDVNEGRASAEQFFVMKNLVTRIDELVAAKA
jgi:acyl carrier protein